MHIVIIGAGFAACNLVQFLWARDKTACISIVTICSGEQYYKPDISKAISENKTADALVKSDGLSWAKKYNVNLHVHVHVTHIDISSKSLSFKSSEENFDTTLQWDKLVFATGAEPRPFDFEPKVAEAIFHVNDLATYRMFMANIDKSTEIAIIGSGLIGCEMASDLAKDGYEVTIYHPHAVPLSKLLPEYFGAFVKRHLQRLGVRFIDNVRLTQVEDNIEGVQLNLSNGEKYCASVVLNCSGLIPNIRLAHEFGLATRYGIQVDDYLQTSVPDIYALGDCVEIQHKNYQYVTPIMKSARVLAGNLLGAQNKVNIGTFPIQIKIQDNEVFLMDRAEPNRWEVESETSHNQDNVESAKRIKGICVKGFDEQNRLVRVALIGSKLDQKGEIMKLMMSATQ